MVITGGRIAACFIMATGLLTLAVITAQVASSFVGQGPSRARPAPPEQADRRDVTLDELAEVDAQVERACQPPPCRRTSHLVCRIR